MRQFTIALLLLGASAFTSCSKDDDPDPASPSNPSNPSTPAVNRKIDASQLRNHWEVISFYNLVVTDSSGKVVEAGGFSQTYHENYITWDPNYTSFITFNADNTFDHSNKDNTGGAPLLRTTLRQHDTYEIRNDDTTMNLPVINNADNTTSIKKFRVVEFRKDYFHLMFQRPYESGQTYYFHLEFKR